MTDLRNCIKCGALYLFTGQDTCPACRRGTEEDYEKIRAYLWKNRGAGLEEIHAGTGVPRAAILKFLRQGRLMLNGEAPTLLSCEFCGQPINTGRLCRRCARDLAVRVGLDREKDDKHVAGDKMHTADRLRPPK